MIKNENENKTKTTVFAHVSEEKISIFYQILKPGSSIFFFKCPQFKRMVGPQYTF